MVSYDPKSKYENVRSEKIKNFLIQELDFFSFIEAYKSQQLLPRMVKRRLGVFGRWRIYQKNLIKYALMV